MVTLDLFLITWLLAGTWLIKYMLAALRDRKFNTLFFWIATVSLSATPLCILAVDKIAFSALSVVLAGATMIWFALLGSRSRTAT